MKPQFDHEKLNVYHTSLKFIVWAQFVFEKAPKSLSAWSQLDRASTSIPINIAEGNGKFTAPDRCRFFDISRGSALESPTVLDVLVAKGELTEEEIQPGKDLLVQVVSILVGLIKSNSPDRLHEGATPYRTGNED